MKKNLVSVFIPCYNEEKFISSSINSVLKQTYKNFELHIVDNCSTDNTLSIVKKFKDKRIFLHKNKKNLGMFGNMNKCLGLASTPYIKILCADDILSPECLEKEVKVLEKYKEVGIVYCASQLIDFEGKNLLVRKHYKKDICLIGKKLGKKLLLFGRNIVGETSITMMRMDVIKKHHLNFDTSLPYSADISLILTVLLNSDAYYINSVLACFRIHKKAGTTKLIKRGIAEHIKLFDKFQKSYNLKKFDKFILYLRLVLFFFARFVFVLLFARK